MGSEEDRDGRKRAKGRRVELLERLKKLESA